MNGGRGGGPMNSLPPAGRGASQQSFGRGRPGMVQHQNQQHYHRNQMPPPPPPQHRSHNNNGPSGPPTMRGGPSSGMMGRGRIGTGHNAFNGGRGRNSMPGRGSFGGRNNFQPGGQQRRGPPPPPRGRGTGQGTAFPPPPPPPPSPHIQRPGFQLGPTQRRNANSQPFQQQMTSQPSSYGVTPGVAAGNRIPPSQNVGGIQLQQPHNSSQQQHQQQYQLPLHHRGPPTSSSAASLPLAYQHLQSQQQHQSRATNNSNYAGYQQAANPRQQPTSTGTLHNNLQQQPTSSLTASSISTAAVSTPSAQEIDEAWKEHTAPGGVKYYHNELSKESTYHKPDALKKKEQPSSSGSATATNTTARTSPSQKRSWQEHEDASTGRKYYSDGVSTTWEKPEGFVSPETIVANTSSATKREQKNNHEGPAKKKKRISNAISSSSNTNNNDTFANKKEATTAFKGLLLAKGVSPTLKWNEVVKVCESDSRWDSFEEILSQGERRQALAEYQTKRTNEMRNEQRQERIRAKEAFGQLLADILPSVSSFSARTSRFVDVRNALSKDDRFFAVEDEATRESLFLDFCDEFKKREERNKRNKKRETQESFESFLQEREEVGTLTYASTWESFLLSLPEKDKADSRFATSKLITDSDRQLYFADFVIELQKVEDDKRRRIRDARRRAEKAQRDEYRELLHKMAVDGKLFPYSRWREIEELLLQDDSFKIVEGQDRDAPRELFETFVDEWDGIYRRERSFLFRLLRPPGKPDVVISAGTTFDSFKKTITHESAYSSEIQNETFRIINREDPVSSVRLLFDELTAQTVDVKRYEGCRRGSTKDDSSEDEGEIIEDGELADSEHKDDN